MRIVINSKLAERNRKIAAFLFLLTLIVLVGGFIFVNYSLFTGELPENLIVVLQAAVLPVAFVLTIFSIRFTNLWARKPFPEDAIAAGLKGISKKSVLYHYYHFPARHVLVAPQGVFAIVTRWHNKRFTVEGSKWKTQRSSISTLLSFIRMDGIGNPSHDAQRSADHIKKLLTPIAPDVEVQPLVIFVDPSVELTIKDPDIPVLYADDKQSPNLTEYLRELNRIQKDSQQQRVSLPLTDEQLQAFEAKTIKA